MIHFVVGARGSFSIRYYLAEEGAALADRIRVIQYDELPRLASLPLGTYVFTETDRLSAPERELVSFAWDRLHEADAGARLMNHPARVLSRYELLCAAHDAGLNRFRAVPASRVAFRERSRSRRTEAAALRYPVFVRFADRHEGSLTPLLESPSALETALASLLGRRMRLEELLVVEFCDTRDARGVYRKYSSFNVGGRVIPRCMECSRDWMVKWSGRILSAECAAEESRYLGGNPHEDWIREVFRLANVEYGRIDYGVRAGEPQVWEINTNPTIGRGPGPRVVDPDVAAYKRILSPGYDTFYRGFLEAWQAADSDMDPGRSVALNAPDALLHAIEVVARRRHNADRWMALANSLARRRWMRPLARTVKRALTYAARTRVRLGG